MKVYELLDLYKGEYVDLEIYELFSKNKGFHTDNLECCLSSCYSIELLKNLEVLGYWLMNEGDYNSEIMANTCENADFLEWYEDKNAKVLVLAVKRDENWYKQNYVAGNLDFIL